MRNRTILSAVLMMAATDDAGSAAAVNETPDLGADTADVPAPAILADTAQVLAPPPFVSTSDQRTTNNVMRHTYRTLSDVDKRHMQTVKDKGLELFEYIDSLGSSRHLSLAKTHLEDAVMRAVKHITE